MINDSGLLFWATLYNALCDWNKRLRQCRAMGSDRWRMSIVSRNRFYSRAYFQLIVYSGEYRYKFPLIFCQILKITFAFHLSNLYGTSIRCCLNYDISSFLATREVVNVDSFERLKRISSSKLAMYYRKIVGLFIHDSQTVWIFWL